MARALDVSHAGFGLFKSDVTMVFGSFPSEPVHHDEGRVSLDDGNWGRSAAAGAFWWEPGGVDWRRVFVVVAVVLWTLSPPTMGGRVEGLGEGRSAVGIHAHGQRPSFLAAPLTARGGGLVRARTGPLLALALPAQSESSATRCGDGDGDEGDGESR